MIKVINPATEEVIKSFEESSDQSIEDSVVHAYKAQKKWRLVPFSQRSTIVEAFRSQLKEQLNDCASLLSLETGKPIRNASGELKATLMRVKWFLDHAERCMQTQVVRKEKDFEEHISYEPLGVVSHISAWNYPYFIGTNIIIPALLTGNAVLYKPSEYSLLTGLKIKELFDKVGLDDHLLQMIIGGASVGSKLVEQKVDGLFFTGSYQTGKKIAGQVSQNLTKFGMELGGKDPVYVDEDCDLPSAAASISSGAFYNTGQSCCSIERIYVHEKVYDQFLEQFKSSVEAYKLGDPKSEATDLGPLTREAQSRILDDHVEDALAKGAKYLVQGGRLDGKGYFYAPSVLIDVDHHMKMMKEESFGPIVGIQKVKDEEEAISLMLDTDYGLTSSVYTRSQATAEKVLRQMNSGSVYWNCSDRVSPYLPWSGRKHSGIGSTLSEIGMKTFLNPKAWHKFRP